MFLRCLSICLQRYDRKDYFGVKKMRFISWCAVYIFLGWFQCGAQTPALGGLTIFLDCGSCDLNYIKQNTREVNYTIDPLRAQVHVLVSTRRLDSGGTMYIFDFIGKQTFEGDRFTIDALVAPQNTPLEAQEIINRTLQVGLVVFLAQNGQADVFALTYRQLPQGGDGRDSSAGVTDKSGGFWDRWIYEVFSSLNWNNESFRSTLDFRYGLGMNFVTEQWRIRFNPNFFYQERYVQNGDSEITFTRRNNTVSSAFIRSISDHWSAGVFYNWNQNTYSNIRYSHWLTPALEYSIFPYEDAVTKEFTIAYRLGFADQAYYEETIFLKMAERLLRQSLELRLNLREPWGNVNVALSGANFFQDFQKNRLTVETNFNVRVLKGLSFNLGADYRLVNDQISLPRGDATLEEILLGQRQLATNFQSEVNFGLRYTFGALYNNIVNTRL
jgi:hypothetical protein